MRTACVIISGILVAGCQSVETPQQVEARIAAESATARTDLEPVRANMQRYFATGNLDSAAMLLTEDHSSLPPNQAGSKGRAQWLAWTRPVFANARLGSQNFVESVVANGPLAVERGRYINTFTPGAGAPAGAKAVADTGKYLWQWRKVDGKWLLAAAAWNSDSPVKK